MKHPPISSNPEYLSLWDYKKNNLDPNVITQGSSKKAWWICSKGHSYEMAINHKCIRKSGCPVCSGHKTVPGVNDFATVYPDIAAEWHPTKNGDKSPSDYSPKNGGRFWWMCKYGHEWQATIHDRADGTGCPVCSKRRLTSFPEQAIFYYIKKLYPDAINRYTDLFDNGMELDIYVPSIRFAVEFDGANWHSSDEAHTKELKKYNICKDNKITLYRVKEHTGENWGDTADGTYTIRRKRYDSDLENVIKAILDAIDPETNMWTRTNPRSIHSSIDVNVKRDKTVIKEYLTPIPNSLVELRPDLVKDWNYEKNGNLKPEMFGINSNDYAWWKCHKCGHEWRTTIIHRGGKRNSGCPKCSREKQGKTFVSGKVSERGSLADNNPSLAAEWHPIKNGDLKPTDITANSFKTIWWLCPKCEYEWKASPNNRNGKKVGCPCCSGRVPRMGVNDLKTLEPELAKEWNYERNRDLLPEQFLPKSSKKVWWKCKRCGCEWAATINSRTSGHGCPDCWNSRRSATISKAPYRKSLAAVYPKLAEEWNYDKNGDLTPDTVFAKAKKKVWWKCSKCECEWQAWLSNRADGYCKCPNCKAAAKEKNNVKK